MLEVTVGYEFKTCEIIINNVILYNEMQDRKSLLFLTLSVLQ